MDIRNRGSRYSHFIGIPNGGRVPQPIPYTCRICENTCGYVVVGGRPGPPLAMRIRQNYIHTADDLRARTRTRDAEAKEERAQRAAQAAEQKAREDAQAAAAAAQQAAQAAAQQEARAAAAAERERIEFERREYHRLSKIRAAQEAQEALKTFKATHVVSLEEARTVQRQYELLKRGQWFRFVRRQSTASRDLLTSITSEYCGPYDRFLAIQKFLHYTPNRHRDLYRIITRNMQERYFRERPMDEKVFDICLNP